MNKRCCIIILTAILLQSCGAKNNQQQTEQKASNESEWVFDKVDSSKLVFKNGQVFNTKLFDLNYIGQIPVGNNAPYLIFSGVDCDQCDANVCIYIYSLSNGELSVGHGHNCYSYPGRQTEFTTDYLVYEGRAFYG